MSIGEGVATVLQTIVPFVEKEVERERGLEDYKRRILAQHALNRKNEEDKKKALIASFAVNVGDTVKDNLANLNIATLNRLATMSAQGIPVLQQEENGPGSLGGGWTIVNPQPKQVTESAIKEGRVSKVLSALATSTDRQATWNNVSSEDQILVTHTLLGKGNTLYAQRYNMAANIGFITPTTSEEKSKLGDWKINTDNETVRQILSNNKISYRDAKNKSDIRGKALDILVSSPNVHNHMLAYFAQQVSRKSAQKQEREVKNILRNQQNTVETASQSKPQTFVEPPTSSTQLVSNAANRWLAETFSQEQVTRMAKDGLNSDPPVDIKRQQIRLTNNALNVLKSYNWIIAGKDEDIRDYIRAYIEEAYGKIRTS